MSNKYSRWNNVVSTCIICIRLSGRFRCQFDVCRARDKSSGEAVAIKKIRIASSEEGMPMSMIREVSMLKLLENFEHPNIVRYKFN